MDSISHLLELARVQARLDKRCLLAGATVMDVAPYGASEAAFHFLLDGQCTLEVGDRSIALAAGDAVLLPSSPSHRIRTEGGKATRTVAETPGATFDTIRTEDDDHATIDLFCGHYTFRSASGSLFLQSLPEPLVVSFGDGTAVRSMTALMRQEALGDGPGAAAILSSICTALLAMVLRQSNREFGTAALWTAVDDHRIARVIDAVPGAGRRLADRATGRDRDDVEGNLSAAFRQAHRQHGGRIPHHRPDDHRGGPAGQPRSYGRDGRDQGRIPLRVGVRPGVLPGRRDDAGTLQEERRVGFSDACCSCSSSSSG